MRVLVIASRFPFPLDKGDKLRLFHQIKFLSQFVDLDLFCLSDLGSDAIDFTPVRPYFKNIHIIHHKFTDKLFGLVYGLFKGLPFSVAYFYNKKAHKTLKEICTNQSYDLFYCQLIRMAPYIAVGCRPCVLDFMDAFSLSYHLRSKYSTSVFHKILYSWESKLIQRYERRIQHDFDIGITISNRDAQELCPTLKPKLKILPNGVDIDYFNAFALLNSNQQFDVVFVGNLGYFPNIQASLFIVNDILPLLIEDFPNIRVLLAGARPDPKILALRSPHVEVMAWLEDIRWAYQQAKVFVVPLFSGAGLQNKMLEAMSMELPCITTEHVNVSLGAVPDRHLLVANDAFYFAEKIKTLLLDEYLRKELGSAARTFVKSNFTWEKSNKKLLTLFEEVSKIN